VPTSFEIDQDNLHMKFSPLNVNFNGATLDPLGSRTPPYDCIKCWYAVENVRFLLLSTNLAREWLEIDTDLLRIITSTADELSRFTNIDDLNDLEPPKFFSELFAILGYDAHLRSEFSPKLLEINQDILRMKLN